MSTDKTLDGVVTEREARLRERAAFVEGVRFRELFDTATFDLDRAARDRYPIRKKVPRVETVDGLAIHADPTGGPNLSVSNARADFCVTPRAARVMLDLSANPFEEVTE